MPPQTIMSMTTPMNRYVGMAKPVPDSRTPRRFKIAMTATMRAAVNVRLEFKAGNADARLATPADTDLYGNTAYVKNTPSCPSGGTYTIGDMATRPVCSIGTGATPSHVLP